LRPFAVVLVVVALSSPLLAQNRHCGPAEKPTTLPPVRAVLDSARVVQGLSASLLAPKGVLLSLVYTQFDSFPQIHVLDASIDSASLLLAHAVVPEKSKQPWAVRVRIAGVRGDSGTDAVALTLERSVYCPPVLVTRPELRELLLVQSRPGDRVMPNLSFRINADVIIAPTGLVSDVRLSQSSGFRDLDDQLVQTLRMRRYLPALVDGFPITSWWRTDGRTMQL